MGGTYVRPWKQGSIMEVTCTDLAKHRLLLSVPGPPAEEHRVTLTFSFLISPPAPASNSSSLSLIDTAHVTCRRTNALTL